MVDMVKTHGGVSFELTDEQKMLQKMAREFTASEIIPVAADFDEHATFPEGIFHKARELGIVDAVHVAGVHLSTMLTPPSSSTTEDAALTLQHRERRRCPAADRLPVSFEAIRTELE